MRDPEFGIPLVFMPVPYAGTICQLHMPAQYAGIKTQGPMMGASVSSSMMFGIYTKHLMYPILILAYHILVSKIRIITGIKT